MAKEREEKVKDKGFGCHRCHNCNKPFARESADGDRVCCPSCNKILDEKNEARKAAEG